MNYKTLGTHSLLHQISQPVKVTGYNGGENHRIQKPLVLEVSDSDVQPQIACYFSKL